MDGARCLVVAGPAAVTPQTSGATLRLATVRGILERNFTVEVVTPAEVSPRKHHGYDLVVGISWPTLWTLRGLAGGSRRSWFDATDSTTVLRPSLTRAGMWKQPLALVRDAANAATFQPDLVTYIAARDRSRDHLLWPKSAIRVLPPQFDLPIATDAKEEGRLLLVGSGLYRPNADAVRWVQRHVLPEMQRRGLHRPIHVVGTGFDGWSARGIHFDGYVADPADLYRPGDVHLAPIRFGAGMKNKVVMPLLMGNRVVTTTEGAVGLKALKSLYVAKNGGTFVDALEEISALPVERNPLEPEEVFACNEYRDVAKLLGDWSRGSSRWTG